MVVVHFRVQKPGFSKKPGFFVGKLYHYQLLPPSESDLTLAGLLVLLTLGGYFWQARRRKRKALP